MRVFQRFKRWAVKAAMTSATYERFRKWFEPKSIFSIGSTSTVATNETIFSAVSRLSNSMASLPLKLYERFKVYSDNAGGLLADQPNPNMTWFDFIRLLETHRNTKGNGYAIKQYDSRYQVSALWVLDPSKVEPVIERDTGELWYQIDGDAGRYYVHNMDVIHVKHIYTMGWQNSYKGISPIDVLKNTIDFDSKVKQFSLDQIDGAIKASFILKMAANVSKEKRVEILESFRSFYKENGGVLLQEQGTEITPIEKKVFVDPKVFEVERITRSRVATVYNMPAYMLGESDGVTYSSMEQMSLEYLQFTILPIVRQYEQEFDRKLRSDPDKKAKRYFKFNLNALLRGDMATRGEFYTKGVRSGYFKPDDVRMWEELPPEGNGADKLYISRDLVPIDQAALNLGGNGVIAQ